MATAHGLTFDRIEARLKKIPKGFRGRVAQFGWFESAIYEDGTPVAYVAIIQEKGAIGGGGFVIPARPFIGPTVEKNKKAWVGIMRDGLRAMAAGKGVSAGDVLEGVGLQAAGDLAKQIASNNVEALSPVTLLLRLWRRQGMSIKLTQVRAAVAQVKSGKFSVAGAPTEPLQATGHLIATISSTVADK